MAVKTLVLFIFFSQCISGLAMFCRPNCERLSLPMSGLDCRLYMSEVGKFAVSRADFYSSHKTDAKLPNVDPNSVIVLYK